MKLLIALGAALLAVPLALTATGAAPVIATGATPMLLAPTTYNIDGVHSSVVFKIQHMGLASFYGRFNKISGTVVLDQDQPAGSKVELTIAADSVDSNNEGRNTHLKSPDFFNAKEFPEIKFVSKSAKKEGDKRWLLDGEMTLHGVTKKLSLAVELVGAKETPKGKLAGFDTTFTFKRSDYGMTGMLDVLGDEITVMAGIECKGQ